MSDEAKSSDIIPWEPSSRDHDDDDDDGLQLTSSLASSMTSSWGADDVRYRRFVMRKDRGMTSLVMMMMTVMMSLESIHNMINSGHSTTLTLVLLIKLFSNEARWIIVRQIEKSAELSWWYIPLHCADIRFGPTNSSSLYSLKRIVRFTLLIECNVFFYKRWKLKCILHHLIMTSAVNFPRHILF